MSPSASTRQSGIATFHISRSILPRPNNPVILSKKCFLNRKTNAQLCDIFILKFDSHIIEYQQLIPDLFHLSPALFMTEALPALAVIKLFKIQTPSSLR
jgi:hypothetical protein